MTQASVLRLSPTDELPLQDPNPKAAPSTRPTYQVHPEVYVTPWLAAEWMGRNNNNRGMSPLTVEQMKRDRHIGLWDEQGRVIRFDWNGDLVDGQHYLTTIMETGTSEWVIVVTGLNPAIRDTIDVVRPRTLKDALLARGESNVTQLASAITIGCLWEHGGLTERYKPSRKQQLRWLENHPGIRASVAAVAPLARKPLSWTPASAAPFHMAAGWQWQEEVERFTWYLTRISEADFGKNPPPSRAIKTFHRWLRGEADTDLALRAKPPTYLANALIAFNAYVQDAPLSACTWKPDGRRPFPELLERSR